jgi:hypothetical protein
MFTITMGEGLTTLAIPSTSNPLQPSPIRPFLRPDTPLPTQTPSRNGREIPPVKVASIPPPSSLRPIHRLRRVPPARTQTPYRSGQEIPPVQVIYFLYYCSLGRNLTHGIATQPNPSTTPAASSATTPGTQPPPAWFVSEPRTGDDTVSEYSQKHRLDHVFPLIWAY